MMPVTADHLKASARRRDWRVAVFEEGGRHLVESDNDFAGFQLGAQASTVLAALLRSMAPWIPRSADTIAQATRRGHVLIGSPDYDGPEFYMTAAVVAPNTRQAAVFYIRTAKRLSAAINTAYYKAYAKSLEPAR